jgi:hypothetical protein
VLDPEVELHADAAAVPSGLAVTIQGADAVARGAVASAGLSRYSVLALVNGSPGVVWAPHGRLARALAFTITGEKISRIEVIADPDRLGQVDLAVLG